MSVFSRLRARFGRTEDEDESRQMLKRQLKECRKHLQMSPLRSPYKCLRFACHKNYVSLIRHVLADLDLRGARYETVIGEASALRVAVVSGNKEAVAALLDGRHISDFPSFPLALGDCATRTNMEMLRKLLFTLRDESRLSQACNKTGPTLLIERAFKMAIKAQIYDNAIVLVEAQFQASHTTPAIAYITDGVSFVDEALLDTLIDKPEPPVSQMWQNLARVLIQQGADLNAIIRGSSILHTVTMRRLYDTAVFLLDENADANQKGTAENTPIFDLIILLCELFSGGQRSPTPARSEDHLLIRSLLSHGAKLDIQNEDGDTPLYPAGRCQNHPLLEILLEGSHDIASVNNRGETVFSIAAANNDFKCMEMLVEKDITLLNKTGPDLKTPLMTAVEGCSGSTVLWLLDAGALTDLTDKEGNTALHYAAAHKDAAIVDMLLNAGASCAIRNNTDWYPVHCAAKAGSFATYKRIIKANASMMHGEYLLGLFVLTMAPETGNIDILRHVMQFKPDVNHVLDDDGAAALHMCIDRGMLDHVCLLLVNGADPNLKLRSGLSPLDLALSTNCWEVAKLLVQKGADPNYSGVAGIRPIHTACLKAQRGLVYELIKNGALIHAEHDTIPPPLHAAIFGRSHEIVRLLLDCGVLPDLFDPTTGTTALQAAKNRGTAAIQKELRDRIANPTDKNRSREFLDQIKNPEYWRSQNIGSPFLNARPLRSTIGNSWSPITTTSTAAPKNSHNTVPTRQSYSSVQPRRNNSDIVPDLGITGNIFGMVSQLAPMLENPQITLRHLRTSTAAQLRNQSQAQIELWNDFIYEAEPWDKEELLDKLNGVGVRIFLDL